MPFSSLEPNMVYPELDARLTFLGRDIFFRQPGTLKLDQSAFQDLMQRNGRGMTEHAVLSDTNLYTITNEYSLTKRDLHLTGEILDLRSWQSLGVVEVSGSVETIRNLLEEYARKLQSKILNNLNQKPVYSPRRDSVRSGAAMNSSPPESAEPQPNLSLPDTGMTHIPTTTVYQDSLLEWLQQFGALLQSQESYRIKMEPYQMIAVPGKGDRYEVTIPFTISPSPGLTEFINKFGHRTEGEHYTLVTIPAPANGLPPFFKSLVNEGKLNQALQIHLYDFQHEEIPLAGELQMVRQSDSAQLDRFLPVYAVKTLRTVIVYILSQPEHRIAKIPVNIPESRGISDIVFRLEGE